MSGSEELVAVDTEILIWGVQKRGNPEERRKVMVPKAEYFFNQFLQENNFKLVIPTPVMREYSVGLLKEGGEIFSAFLEHCIVVDFDYKAAIIASEIWKKKEQIKGEINDSRRCITSDCKIIAAAKANGGSAIYTEDDDIVKLARLINYPARPLPEVPPQNMELFDNDLL